MLTRSFYGDAPSHGKFPFEMMTRRAGSATAAIPCGRGCWDDDHSLQPQTLELVGIGFVGYEGEPILGVQGRQVDGASDQPLSLMAPPLRDSSTAGKGHRVQLILGTGSMRLTGGGFIVDGLPSQLMEDTRMERDSKRLVIPVLTASPIDF